jgi:cell division protein FtsW (lipid II flippase)
LAQKREWTPIDRRWCVAFVSAFDAQVLLGLLLYVVFSPIVPRSSEQFRAAMAVRPLRFFAIEHVSMMVLALAIAHVSSVRIRKSTSSTARLRWMAFGFGLAFLIMFMSIPWPWMPTPRPLFRGF